MPSPAAESVKDQLHQIADSLPDDATWEYVIYVIRAREAIASGRRAFAEGRWSSHEDVGRRLGLLDE